MSEDLLVVGAAGMLGRDVVAAATRSGRRVTALGHDELDVTDERAVLTRVAAERPSAVINCAAFTDVDGAETRPKEAFAVNGDGAGHVAAAAAAVGATVVYVSTDYVFDGRKSDGYVESDTPDALSTYGRSKAEGERATAAANPAHHVVRTSWLFGAGGPNFVETMLALGAARDQVRVVDDQVGCPTATAHLAPRLVELAGDDAYGVRHLAATGSCSWRGFAEEIFRRARLDCRALAQSTADAGRPAPRPACSILHSERPDVAPLPPWTEGLDLYLAARVAA